MHQLKVQQRVRSSLPFLFFISNIGINGISSQYIHVTRYTFVIVETCVNTRDNGNGHSCVNQIKWGSTCVNYLEWGDCDQECGLCACSTAIGTTREHCSGHGECEAICEKDGCTDAKCRCKEGWIGDKCEIPGKSHIILRSNSIETVLRQSYSGLNTSD